MYLPYVPAAVHLGTSSCASSVLTCTCIFGMHFPGVCEGVGVRSASIVHPFLPACRLPVSQSPPFPSPHFFCNPHQDHVCTRAPLLSLSVLVENLITAFSEQLSFD